MMSRVFTATISFLIFLLLVACGNRIQPGTEKTLYGLQTVEVTRVVSQTIEVTRIVQQPSIIPEPTVNPVSVTVQTDSSSIQIEPAYFDGIVVLTRYYALIDHGLFEEVLPLYSSSLLKKSEGKNFESDLKSVKVKSIRPYNYWLAQQGLPSQTIPKNEIRYVVGTIVFHKAPAWNKGGTPVPDEQTRFVSLVLEGGEWKLNEFNSSPWFK